MSISFIPVSLPPEHVCLYVPRTYIYLTLSSHFQMASSTLRRCRTFPDRIRSFTRNPSGRISQTQSTSTVSAPNNSQTSKEATRHRDSLEESIIMPAGLS